jgi:hypothetical protein
MANWREDYYAALAARDDREQANSILYDACMRDVPPEKIKHDINHIC